jgi:hypothetical protein
MKKARQVLGLAALPFWRSSSTPNTDSSRSQARRNLKNLLTIIISKWRKVKSDNEKRLIHTELGFLLAG